MNQPVPDLSSLESRAAPAPASYSAKGYKSPRCQDGGLNEGNHTMNQLVDRMCSLSNCCVSSRDRDRDRGPMFEERLRDMHRRGVDTSNIQDRENAVYADYEFENSQSQEITPSKDKDAIGAQHVTAMFPFQGKDPQPFPPDPYPDLSIEPVSALDEKNDERRGWVPGNYVTNNGKDPYMKAGGQLEEKLWNEVQQTGGASTSDEFLGQSASGRAEKDSTTSL